jgi:hypothetical protein
MYNLQYINISTTFYKYIGICFYQLKKGAVGGGKVASHVVGPSVVSLLPGEVVV